MVVSAFGHFRINHSDRFVKAQTHLNGIENYWNQAKRHLRKYNGIPQQHFDLFLKKCKWCFNRHVPQAMLQHLKEWFRPTRGESLFYASSIKPTCRCLTKEGWTVPGQAEMSVRN
ncbi:MAG: transposase [Nitrospinae bacterium]|nr:transposase [Nitrospinota bacterium]